jgi:hypothetical protein
LLEEEEDKLLTTATEDDMPGWIIKYLTLYGMFENKTGSSYSTLNDINEDSFTWKHYDIV